MFFQDGSSVEKAKMTINIKISVPADLAAAGRRKVNE